MGARDASARVGRRFGGHYSTMGSTPLHRKRLPPTGIGVKDIIPGAHELLAPHNMVVTHRR